MFKIGSPQTLDILEVEQFDKILFSPGPGLPEEHPMMFEILEKYGTRKPILGICLGMQAIAVHYGGSLFNQPEVFHGRPKKLMICHPDHYPLKGITNGTGVGLYHSWAVEPASLPERLEVTAVSDDGVIMALRHRDFDVSGFQFHPESFMTPTGKEMILNWLNGPDGEY